MKSTSTVWGCQSYLDTIPFIFTQSQPFLCHLDAHYWFMVLTMSRFWTLDSWPLTPALFSVKVPYVYISDLCVHKTKNQALYFCSLLFILLYMLLASLDGQVFCQDDQVHAFTCKHLGNHSQPRNSHYHIAVDPFPWEHHGREGSACDCDSCELTTIESTVTQLTEADVASKIPILSRE